MQSEEAIFNELSTASNQATIEIIAPTPKIKGEKKKSKNVGSGDISAPNTLSSSGQKENWEDLTEKAQLKKKELQTTKNVKKASKNNLLIR